jgi:hypothetical protein
MVKVKRAARPVLLALSVGTLAATPAASQDAPRLSLPIDCQPGVTCFLQSHVDAVPGPESGDFRCGSATYDGHKGVDFRLLSVAAAREGEGVAVLAAADGVVKGGRDGMTDELAAPDRRAAIANRECGNGVTIDHGAGWETQYCHMLKGSVTAKPGDWIARGQKLGRVGYSGLAEFAHVHISVRHNGAMIDPFTASAGEAACRLDGAAGAAGLWDDNAARAFPYRNGEIIGAGFAGAPVTPLQLETDHRIAPPDAASPALLLYARLVNLRVGDSVRFVLSGPDGLAHQQVTAPLDRNKATFVVYTGKKLTKPRWPAGRYEGRVELLRQGAVVEHRVVEPLDLK